MWLAGQRATGGWEPASNIYLTIPDLPGSVVGLSRLYNRGVRLPCIAYRVLVLVIIEYLPVASHSRN